MIDRRAFLHLSVGAAVLAQAPLALARVIDGPRPWLVVSGRCADVVGFTRHCAPDNVSVIDALDVLDTLANDSPASCVGLGPDSQFFIITQMARAYGYRLAYHGEHAYRDDQVQHTLSGAAPVIDALANSFSRAGAQWAQALAGAVSALGHDQQDHSRVSINSAALRPAGSHGHLVSWCLQRA